MTGEGAGLVGGAAIGASGQPVWTAAAPPMSGNLVNADLFMQPTSNTAIIKQQQQDEMINESRGEASVAFDLPA